MSNILDQYPYLNVNDLNLDYILNAIKKFQNEVTNFVSINAIKYANPIQWNITSQYEKNTIVIDPQSGTAYISVAAVPSGVALTREEYWTVVFNLGSFVTRAARNFTDRYEADTTLTATFSTSAGEWLVWGDVLYKALVNITAGDAYVEGSNIQHITMEDIYNEYLNMVATILAIVGDLVDLNSSDKTSIVNAINSVIVDFDSLVGDLNDLTTTDKSSVVNAINEVNTNIGDLVNLNTTDKSSIVNAINSHLASNSQIIINVKDYGAVGDGVTDDTSAINSALIAGEGHIVYFPSGTYLFTTKITIQNNTHVILSEDAVIKYDYDNIGSWPRVIMFGDNTSTPSAYNGGHNIIFEGGVVDMGFASDFVPPNPTDHMGVCMVLWHNDNIIIKNVTFKHTFNDHCIELNSSRNVVIENCKFVDCYAYDYSTSTNYEAINIDWATSVNAYEGAFDYTECQNIFISNCVFDNVTVGIGEHGFDPDNEDEHLNINIDYCVFRNCKNAGIHAIHWKYAHISNIFADSSNIHSDNWLGFITLQHCLYIQIYECVFDGVNCDNAIIAHVITISGVDYANYNISIHNNTFRYMTATTAIYLYLCWRGEITNNEFSNVAASNVIAIRRGSAILIDGNLFDASPTAATSYPIRVYGSVSTLDIRNNIANNIVAYNYDVYNDGGNISSSIIDKLIGSTRPTTNADATTNFINGIKRIFAGDVSSGSITLSEDITKVNKLIFMVNQSGSGSRGAESVIVFPWYLSQRFSDDSDNYINYTSRNGFNQLTIDSGTQLTIDNVSDNIRLIGILL